VTLKDATKVTLMLPIPWFLVMATIAITSGEPEAFQRVATGFVAVYTPALGAFVTGTSIKRGQEKKGAS